MTKYTTFWLDNACYAVSGATGAWAISISRGGQWIPTYTSTAENMTQAVTEFINAQL